MDAGSTDRSCRSSKRVLPRRRWSAAERTGDQSLANQCLTPPWAGDSAGFEAAIRQIEQFNRQHHEPRNGKAIVDAIEVKADTIDQVQEIATRLPKDLVAFLEIPHQDDPRSLVESIAQQGSSGENAATGQGKLRAKIRTGGVTADLIPSPEEAARFIAVCAEQKVGFKATAGLHHPLRSEFPLTYEAHSPRATMHGFLNVFAAAVVAFSLDVTTEQLAAIIASETATELSLAGPRMRVGQFEISAEQIAVARQQGIESFGSCSFDEPTKEIEALGFLVGANTTE